MKAITLSAIAAIAIQPLFFFIWFFAPYYIIAVSVISRDLLEMISLIVFFSSLIIVLLGVPIFLVLRHFNSVTWISLANIGFLLPAIPVSVLNWPRSSGGDSFSGTWHGQYVDYVVNGVPTVYGWLQYAEGVLMFGLHGLIGALVFFFVWRKITSNG